MYLAFELDCTI